jgi:hypothetical protein
VCRKEKILEIKTKYSLSNIAGSLAHAYILLEGIVTLKLGLARSASIIEDM